MNDVPQTFSIKLFDSGHVYIPPDNNQNQLMLMEVLAPVGHIYATLGPGWGKLSIIFIFSGVST